MPALKLLLPFAAVLFLAWCALALYLYFFQARFLYFPERVAEQAMRTPASAGLAFETVHFTAADGVQLHGWFVPATPARAVLLFMHGNAGNISGRLESIARFQRLGLSVFIFDYRGYGASEGRTDEAGTYSDARGAWDYLTRVRGISPLSVVLFGRSLGGAVASQLATQVNPAAVIIESAFTSVPDMAAGLYPFLPARSLSRFRYPTSEHIGRLGAPVLIVHSRADEIIPFRHAQHLFGAAQEPKQFLEIQGGHNAGFLPGEAYGQGLLDFIEASGVRPPDP